MNYLLSLVVVLMVAALAVLIFDGESLAVVGVLVWTVALSVGMFRFLLSLRS